MTSSGVLLDQRFANTHVTKCGIVDLEIRGNMSKVIRTHSIDVNRKCSVM